MSDSRETNTIYDAAGGIDAFRAIASAWHQRAMADDVVQHAFSRGFRHDHVERLAAYLAETLGGPPLYTTKYGTEVDVVRMHSGNGAHQEMDERAVACFASALIDCGILESTELHRTLSEYWKWSTHGRMARYEDSADSVPPSLTMPKWSWDGPLSA